MPTKPDILEVIPVFHMKIILDSTYQAYAMMGNNRNCGISQHHFFQSVLINHIPMVKVLLKLWEKDKQNVL